MTGERDYPITPAPFEDDRFNFGLIHDVAGVLEQHGYPKVQHSRDLGDLMHHLWRYLYEPRDLP